MAVQNSPQAKNTRSQRHQAVLTPTELAPLDRKQSVNQLSANLDRGPPMEGGEPSRRGGGEESEETEVEAALTGVPEASDAANLANSSQPLLSQAEPNFFKMMEQMSKLMEQLTQAVSPRENSNAPEFKTPSIREPNSFYGTQGHKLRGFIQSCQLVFHNDPVKFFSDRNKVLYSTSFLTGRAGKWIEPYLSNISNEDPSYLLNSWNLFETQLFTLFCGPNEVRIAYKELDNLRMWESVHVSLYISDSRSSTSRIGDWGERAYIHVYRRGFSSRLLDQLASHPGSFDTIQELMDITLELDTRYHERQKEKGSHQDKKPPVTGSNISRPPQASFVKGLITRRERRGRIFKSQRTCPMLLSSISTRN
ncbi:hypothetical protein O181_046186 [Austropuccinia psidii MF-1]|uniref:Ty3 transposon capsid-like protein domain-containing protein n=1 Tax=Austropuccinia psidii MF-1 TaxID=1389203 RepID=A0A9Q3HIE4_9BASI|nr:hypothetical protein [Austropuccinia psidii MF-1]